MGNVCTKRGDASVSSLELDDCREPLPLRTARTPDKSANDSSTATFQSVDGCNAKALRKPTVPDDESSGSVEEGDNARALRKLTAEEEDEADLFMMSNSASAVSTHRNGGHITTHGSPLPDTTDVKEASIAGTTTHHTDSATSDSTEDAGPQGIVKATKRKQSATAADGVWCGADAPPNATHGMGDADDVKPDGPQHDTTLEAAERLQSGSVYISAPPSPVDNPLRVRRHGSGLPYHGTPSTHLGPMHSASSSVAERDAVTCDVHIEVEADTSMISEESACGFETMLRALQPPTVCERSEIVRNWIDQVPRKRRR